MKNFRGLPTRIHEKHQKRKIIQKIFVYFVYARRQKIFNSSNQQLGLNFAFLLFTDN